MRKSGDKSVVIPPAVWKVIHKELGPDFFDSLKPRDGCVEIYDHGNYFDVQGSTDACRKAIHLSIHHSGVLRTKRQEGNTAPKKMTRKRGM